jgi:hypothetical protein
MKIPLLTLICIAFSTAIYAQNPRIVSLGDRRTETYLTQKGYDSVRYTILGAKDTIEMSNFYLNGKISSTSWKKDSSHHFDALGRLTSKDFNSEFAPSFDRNHVVFGKNGHIFSSKFYERGLKIEKYYNDNGEVRLTNITQSAPLVTYVKHLDRNGVPISSSRFDTLKVADKLFPRQFDTIFHANGRPFQTSTHLQTNGQFNEYSSLGLLLWFKKQTR